MEPAGRRRVPSIEVVGIGKVEVISDQVEAQLGVEATRPGQEEAARAVAEQADRLRALLDRYEVAAPDRQTIWTFVRPVHDNYGRETGQFTAGHWLMIRLHDVAVASRLLGEATRTVGAGLRIANTQWSLSRKEDHEAEARRRAVADAAERARQLAAAAGVRLGRLLRIVEGADHAEQMMYRAQSAMAAESTDANMPIEPGRQTVAIRVDLAYAIGDDPEPDAVPEEPPPSAAPEPPPAPPTMPRDPADPAGEPPAVP
jgi:uncharacterized protein YggE